VKFSQSDKDFFAAVRKEEPCVDEMFISIRQLTQHFPGAELVYLKVMGKEWGDPGPRGVPMTRIYEPTSVELARAGPPGDRQRQKRRRHTRHKE
jgi:hypothetical protein